MTAKPRALLALCGTVSLALYSKGFHGPLFLDDFLSLSADWQAYVVYRPLEKAYLALVRAAWGTETLPIHLTAFVMHALLGGLTYPLARLLGATRLGAAIASAFMLLSQANVSAVAGNDTISQVGATLAGYISLCLLLASQSHGGVNQKRSLFAASLVAQSVALLAKETAVAFVPLLSLACLGTTGGPGRPRRLGRGALLIVPYLLVLGGYLLLRRQVGAQMPSASGGVFAFAVGQHVFVNLGFQAIIAFLPSSSVPLVSSLRRGDALGIGVSVLALCLCLAFLVAGAVLGRVVRQAILLSAAALSTAFPMVLMARATEVYTYNMTPLVACVVGLSAAGWLGLRRGPPAIRPLAAGAFVLLASSHALAVRDKVAMMAHNGERAQILLPQVVQRVAALPPGARLLLVNPPFAGPEYSVFLVYGFNVLRFGEEYVQQQAARLDADVEIADAALPQGESAATEVVTLSGDAVVSVPTETHRP